MCWPGSWHFSKSVLSAVECGWQRLLASCQCIEGWPLVVRCSDSLAYKECASLQRWNGLGMSNVWKHPKNLSPGHTMLPSLTLKSLFSSFSLHFSLSTLPHDVQPGLRVLSFGGWDPDEVFPLMAACLGFILHSGVCEAEITSYTFFPFFF